MLGYDFEKPDFLNGAIQGIIYFFLGGNSMYMFTSTEIKTNSTHLKIGLPCHNVEIILCCQYQLCFRACLYVNCFDVYFILLKILEVYTIKPCSAYFISYRQMNHLCIEHCSCRGKHELNGTRFWALRC